MILTVAFSTLACAQVQDKETMSALRDRVFDVAKVQAVYMDSLLTDGRCPRTFQDGKLVTSNIDWWCSGFYPGVLWMLYGETADLRFRQLAVKHTLPLAELLDHDIDHDIGFQLMSSFGRWFVMDFFDPRKEDILPPLEIKDILYKGAELLADRFDPAVGAIRSWNHGRWNYPVIIDNMMNLELLMEFGDHSVAEKHALTTMKNHFREDGTCWHLVDYADDGSVLGKQTVQGFSDDTAWGRGQAWALYGYAMMAQHEKKNKELADAFYGVAAKLENWLYAHLPEDGIPYWDFSQTDYKDASAGAIIACGLLKMWLLRDCPADDPALATAERILRTLASPEYLAEPRTNGGFLLKHGVGNIPSGSEVDVPLTYADYYFLEAMSLFPASDISLNIN